ncbi:MAG: cation:proton antiporter, partial [Candidatus Diapherotrites archaeon]
MPVVNQIAIIFATGLVLKLLSKKTGFPFVVLLILAGSFLASISLIDNKQLGIIPDTLRILAIVIIVFANGFYLRLESITKQGFLILGLATIGVLISAGIIASVVHVTLGLALIPSL